KISLELKSWDPVREFELFKSLIFSNDLALATSYSLLIESQVNSIIDYPKWSKGEHLLAQSGSLIDFINPILLFIVNRSQYNSLKLKPEYQSILDEVLR